MSVRGGIYYIYALRIQFQLSIGWWTSFLWEVIFGGAYFGLGVKEYFGLMGYGIFTLWFLGFDIMDSFLGFNIYNGFQYNIMHSAIHPPGAAARFVESSLSVRGGIYYVYALRMIFTRRIAQWLWGLHVKIDVDGNYLVKIDYRGKSWKIDYDMIHRFHIPDMILFWGFWFRGWFHAL